MRWLVLLLIGLGFGFAVTPSLAQLGLCQALANQEGDVIVLREPLLSEPIAFNADEAYIFFYIEQNYEQMLNNISLRSRQNDPIINPIHLLFQACGHFYNGSTNLQIRSATDFVHRADNPELVTVVVDVFLGGGMPQTPSSKEIFCSLLHQTYQSDVVIGTPVLDNVVVFNVSDDIYLQYYRDGNYEQVLAYFDRVIDPKYKLAEDVGYLFQACAANILGESTIATRAVSVYLQFNRDTELGSFVHGAFRGGGRNRVEIPKLDVADAKVPQAPEIVDNTAPTTTDEANTTDSTNLDNIRDFMDVFEDDESSPDSSTDLDSLLETLDVIEDDEAPEQSDGLLETALDNSTPVETNFLDGNTPLDITAQSMAANEGFLLNPIPIFEDTIISMDFRQVDFRRVMVDKKDVLIVGRMIPPLSLEYGCVIVSRLDAFGLNGVGIAVEPGFTFFYTSLRGDPTTQVIDDVGEPGYSIALATLGSRAYAYIEGVQITRLGGANIQNVPGDAALFGGYFDATASPDLLNCTMLDVAVYEIRTDGVLRACTVTPNATSANKRAGAGTNFDIPGQLTASQPETATAQIKGDDDFVWWQLEDESYVRSDVVIEQGDCNFLPLVGDEEATILRPNTSQPTTDDDTLQNTTPQGSFGNNSDTSLHTIAQEAADILGLEIDSEPSLELAEYAFDFQEFDIFEVSGGNVHNAIIASRISPTDSDTTGCGWLARLTETSLVSILVWDNDISVSAQLDPQSFTDGVNVVLPDTGIPGYEVIIGLVDDAIHVNVEGEWITGANGVEISPLSGGLAMVADDASSARSIGRHRCSFHDIVIYDAVGGTDPIFGTLDEA